MRYFSGENAGRAIRAGQREFPFTIVSFYGGTHQGVMAVADEDAELVIRGSGNRLTEINAEEYEEALKKKAPIPASPSLAKSQPARPLTALKGAGAVVAEGAKFTDPKPADLPSDIDDAVDLGTGAPPIADVSEPNRGTSRTQTHRKNRGTD